MLSMFSALCITSAYQFDFQVLKLFLKEFLKLSIQLRLLVSYHFEHIKRSFWHSSTNCETLNLLVNINTQIYLNFTIVIID